MPTHIVKWKPVRCKSKYGSDIDTDIANMIDSFLSGALLSKILEMPPKKPISFEAAIRTVRYQQNKEFEAENYGEGPGQYGWYDTHFTEWISSMGYHIELTGDEFEIAGATEKIA